MHDVAAVAARFIAARSDEPISLADVADHVGYSPFHLARSFERHVGVPPGQFLAAHRFQRAKELLLSGNDRIIDVCFAVGFTSVGTFTTRFAAAVGVSPTEFRRLPDVLADFPPEPIMVPGRAANGGVVTGAVHLSPAASAVLGDAAAVYVGLFDRRAARGVPISGSLLAEPGPYTLTDIPPGAYWLLASAMPARADVQVQLVPSTSVVGRAVEPVRVSPSNPWHFRDVYLDVAESWTQPVLVALPPLASAGAQDWRRHGTQRALVSLSGFRDKESARIGLA